MPGFGRGDDFDSYVLQQIEMREDAISLVGDYAARGETPELQAFAARLPPRLEERLRIARGLTMQR
ncbi:DUF4142 domain-containing protein [Methylosinus sp. Ce-a6]|uniref:DUF4142 domain-containing protein n=1 Tax=Methylosinus sp. Ce-a6 TaxID=2172005 RepID=UPI00210F632F|nr:DUF4142 domain-containing protein [Methylosinus sp. Ce-a6]